MKEIIDCSLAKKYINFFIYSQDCTIITLTELIAEFTYSVVQCVFVILINLQLKVISLCHVINYML